MRRLLLASLVALALAGPSQAAVSVTNDRMAITTKLGRKFTFHSRIENRAATPARDLVAHLNVVDLTGHTYVDPEDLHLGGTLPVLLENGTWTGSWPHEICAPR